MKAAVKTLKIATASWIALVVVASGVSGIVLCIGADGHIAFEAGYQGRCRNAAAAHDHERHGVVEMLAGTDSGCCGDCVDVSFSSQMMSQPRSEVRHGLPKTELLSKLFAASCEETAVDAAIGLGRPLLPGCAAPLASPALLAQRTIVLRI